ncbi:hypothetical protein HDU92_005955 [Lobulomyces angularis]|nr:hypothetical protein HDU92_005955 [Lobulomyces angularis]
MSQKQQQPEKFDRVTIIVENDTKPLNFLSNLNANLVAVRPCGEKSFFSACSSSDIDIIQFDFSERLGYNLKHTTVNLAIQKGIYFEICYSLAIEDENIRKNMIGNSASLIRATRGKNIIVSSGASNPIYLRGPYDVINLCSIFGLNSYLAKSCLLKNCRKVLLHADTRINSLKGIISLKRKAEEIE